MKTERRNLAPGRAEVCVERGCKKPKIRGYASVFYDGSPETEYRFGEFVERISPKAFDRALKERQAVVGLFNHDVNQVLGKTTSGTLTLSVDRRGLKYEIDPPDTQAGRDVVEMVSRGDLDGSSFSFHPTRQSWADGESGEPDIRTVEDVDLVDVSVVTFPAYSGATVEAASRDHEAWRRRCQLERAQEALTRVEKLIESGSTNTGRSRQLDATSG